VGGRFLLFTRLSNLPFSSPHIERSLGKERIHTSQLVCTCPHNLEIRWH
jgi:hypothetical protein